MTLMVEVDVDDVNEVCDVDEVNVDNVGDGEEVGDVVYRDEVKGWSCQQFFAKTHFAAAFGEKNVQPTNNQTGNLQKYLPGTDI